MTASASFISQLYPGIRRILLFAAFEEADADSEPNYQQIIFTPDTEAIFLLQCSREGCVGGGFDLTTVVDDMVRKNECRVHGHLACAGTLGPEGHRCSLKADYRIIVD